MKGGKKEGREQIGIRGWMEEEREVGREKRIEKDMSVDRVHVHNQ